MTANFTQHTLRTADGTVLALRTYAPAQETGRASIVIGGAMGVRQAFYEPFLYFLWVLVPLATRLCRYFPGRTLRKVGDLPAGVMMQWRRWCLHPQYSLGAEGDAARRGYGEVRFPVLAWSISDDELMTLRGTQTLVGFYANAPRAVERIEPGQAQVRRIGHFGFFRAQFEASLWPRALDGLRRLPAMATACA